MAYCTWISEFEVFVCANIRWTIIANHSSDCKFGFIEYRYTTKYTILNYLVVNLVRGIALII